MNCCVEVRVRPAWRNSLSSSSDLPRQLAGGLTIASAGLVLVARAAPVPDLERALCLLGPMRANAAVCFLLAGGSLALLGGSATNRVGRSASHVLGAAAALGGAITLAESLAGVNLGIDKLLHFRSLGCDVESRMPPVTSLAFTLVGLALVGHGGPRQQASKGLATGAAVLVAISTLGILYGASVMHPTGRFLAMTPHAAGTFIVLCGGFFFSCRKPSVLIALPSGSPESNALQGLLLAALVLPIVGGWVLVFGVRVGLFDTAFGAAVLVTVGVLVFASKILRDARDLDASRLVRAEIESRFQHLVESSPDGVLVVDRRGLIRLANQRVERLTGYSRHELLGQSIEILVPPRMRGKHVCDRTEYQQHPKPQTMDECWPQPAVRKDGSEFQVEVSLSPLQDAGEPAIVAFVRDVTQREATQEALRQSEDQLKQAQKMEAVGQLAGGIAHDFNNLLTVIVGFSDLLLDRFKPEAQGRAEIEEIRRAAMRAADLTRQLLAFGRRQIVHPTVLDANSVVEEMDSMIRRLSGEDVTFVTVLAAHALHVKMDMGQLEQVLINLVVNARDAMPQGGKLSVETAVVGLDGPAAGRLQVEPGRYALISVGDTGTGIAAEALPHIFEPFFTTKAVGKGTGLGLATAYGVVKQAGGFIDVESVPGDTRFKIYLPMLDEPLTSMAAASHDDGQRLEGKTILVVEDDAGIRDLMRTMLTAEGCRLLEAPNGVEALRLLSQHRKDIDLVLTDVVMPEMGGGSFAERLTQRYPDLKVLFMSGYPGETIANRSKLDPGVPLLEKPFSWITLKGKLVEMLN